MSDEHAWQSKSRFFFMWVKINIHTCSSYMCGIFFSVFFFKAKKKTHACLKTYVEFFVKFVIHHTSPMNILGFFSIPKLGLKALYELFQ